MRKLSLIALLSTASFCQAQRMSSAAHFAPHAFAPGTNSVVIGQRGGFHGFPGRQNFYPFYPYGLFAESYYPSASEDSNYRGVPQTIILQLPPTNTAAADSYDPPKPPTSALMIELQGDHYVQVSEESTSKKDQPAPADHSKQISVATTSFAAQHPSSKRTTDLPPATLIFRDGHTEQVHDYTIADGTLYARGDLYTDGYWNKKITLASLNLPETIKSNHDQGVTFTLPRSPNEVITRF
jgi:hypothetical protein